jgi:Uma2 family endonuclease
MSVEAWRELERTSHDRKHEYIDGQVYAMAGGSLDHSQTSINVVLVLRGALGRGPCRVYNSDAAARLSPTRYTYPDATVTCDERDRGGVTEIQAPRVIVEVLSPDSTEGYDRGRKSGYYRACPTVQEYVLVATDHQAVEVYRRTAEGWGTFQAYGPDEEMELPSINVRFPVAALYELTEVPEILDAPEGAV